MLNPQGLLPALELDDGCVLTQSLAICEYLDDLFPEPPLLPRGPYDRARVRALAQVIACDIHPVQNLKVLARLRENGLTEDAVSGLGPRDHRRGAGPMITSSGAG